jgi:hypothetical protein
MRAVFCVVVRHLSWFVVLSKRCCWSMYVHVWMKVLACALSLCTMLCTWMVHLP